MDILNRIKMDIKRVDKDLLEIEAYLSKTNKHDTQNRNELLTLKSKYRKDKIKLLKSYHDANQDVNVRNEEIRQRIEEIKARVSMMKGESNDKIGISKLFSFMDSEVDRFIREESDKNG